MMAASFGCGPPSDPVKKGQCSWDDKLNCNRSSNANGKAMSFLQFIWSLPYIFAFITCVRRLQRQPYHQHRAPMLRMQVRCCWHVHIDANVGCVARL